MDIRNDQINQSIERNSDESLSNRRSMLRNLGAASLGVLAVDALTASKKVDAAVVSGQVVTHIATVADLRTVVPSYDGQQFELLGYTVKGKGGGIVYYDATDNVSVDNGTTIFVHPTKFYRFKRPKSQIIDVYQAGALGGSNDDTDAINKAIAIQSVNGGGGVALSKDIYLIDGNLNSISDDSGPRGGIIMRPNVTLYLNGSTLILKKSATTTSAIINCSTAHDFAIFGGGALLIGDLEIQNGSGEYGHGLYMSNAYNFTVENLVVSKCWGDGIYVGPTLFSNPNSVGRDGTFKDVTTTLNRRQGMSLVGAARLLFERCKFLSTGAIKSTAPSAGVDIEPELNGVIVDSIHFLDCTFAFNSQGLLLYSATPGALIRNITVTNANIYGNTSSAYWCNSPNAGGVTFNGGYLDGGVYGCTNTTFNDTKMLKSYGSTSSYVVEIPAGSVGAIFNDCEIQSVGASYKLLYVAGGGEIGKPVFTNTNFIAQSAANGTNILLITFSPVLFKGCNFTTNGTVASGYFGLDSEKVGPEFATLIDCYIDPKWHNGSSAFTGRFTMSYRTEYEITSSSQNHINAALNDFFVFNFLNSYPSSIDAPALPYRKIITLTIRNLSSTNLGQLSWNSIYKMAHWTQPAPGFSRSISFKYNGTNWIEISRTPLDVPN